VIICAFVLNGFSPHPFNTPIFYFTISTLQVKVYLDALFYPSLDPHVGFLSRNFREQ